jgi:hypothetical protein
MLHVWKVNCVSLLPQYQISRKSMTEASEPSKSGKVPEAQAAARAEWVAGERQLHKVKRKRRLLVVCNQPQTITRRSFFSTSPLPALCLTTL